MNSSYIHCTLCCKLLWINNVHCVVVIKTYFRSGLMSIWCKICHNLFKICKCGVGIRVGPATSLPIGWSCCLQIMHTICSLVDGQNISSAQSDGLCDGEYASPFLNESVQLIDYTCSMKTLYNSSPWKCWSM